MSEVIQHIKKGLDDSYAYNEYEDLIECLLGEGKSTTKNAGDRADGFVEYSKLGIQRMKRWDKKLTLTSEQKDKIRADSRKRTWLVLAEGWCGDAAHSLPVIHKMTEANPYIDFRIVLREEHPELMNDFLTNGGKSIPKLIDYDVENEKVLGTWGPRPKPAQKIFLEAKEKGIGSEIYDQDLQKWYNRDKGQTAIQELLALLKN